MQPVQLLYADSGSAPTGTGSFSYFANFNVLVQNLAFAKQVRILAHDFTGWNFHPCSFASFAPENTELWAAHVGSPAIDQFVVEYQVQDQTFWDNNGLANYLLDVAASQTDGIGSVALNPFVQLLSAGTDGSGRLSVDVLVKNLAFAKQVGIVFTTDAWATNQLATGFFRDNFAPFGNPNQPNAELWNIAPIVGLGAHGQFAVFYEVNGTTFWDNNQNANYPF